MPPYVLNRTLAISVLTSGPMGAAMWIAAGVAAALLARVIPLGAGRLLPEASVAILAAMLLGILATALDFGGWNEADWRAGVFCALGGLAAIGALRALRS